MKINMDKPIHNWRPFNQARSFVHDLGLKSEKDWAAWAKSDARPSDIPAYPREVYQDKGWAGSGDWLGTNTIAPQNRTFSPFEDVRAFAHSLMLNGAEEWRQWAKAKERPINIPANPPSVYRGKGWVSWGDWLGTGVVANQKRNYQPFKQARAFAHNLGLKGKGDWAKWCKTDARPKDIPTNPPEVYRNKGWVSWGDWLGTNTIANFNRTFLPFEDARAFVHSLGLKSMNDWRKWSKSGARPDNIPGCPSQTYRYTGWISFGDWLGTNTIAPQKRSYKSFEEARSFVHNLRLKSMKEWMAWAKTSRKPSDIPANPAGVYSSKGWTGWGDWLGTGTIANINRTFLSFKDAHAFVLGLGLTSQSEWRTWCKTTSRPDSIPANPVRAYQGSGWISWRDWLGTAANQPRKRNYRMFEEARAYVQTLGLESKAEWGKWAKSDARPTDIPAWPPDVYKDNGWISWGDWLGTGTVAPQNRSYRNFEDARSFAQSLKLKGQIEWRIWGRTSAKPDDIPVVPDRVYEGEGWVDWSDWLGTRYRRGRHLPFADARDYVHSLGLKSKTDWVKWSMSDLRPAGIPATPARVYRGEGWAGWGDWLGTGVIATFNKIYLPFEDARAFVHRLGLETTEEWRAWSKTPSKPDGIPANPYGVYQKNGWAGWGDWLGVYNLWNRSAVLSFLRSIEPVFQYLEPSELYAIMRQNGMLASSSDIKRKQANLINNIRDLCSSPDPETGFDKLISDLETQNTQLDNEELPVDELEPVVFPSEEEAREELPELHSLTALKVVDTIVDAGITSDEETIEFLLANRVNRLWQAVLNNELTFDIESLRNEIGGAYFNIINQRFFTQYDGSQSLAIPKGYDFRVEGKPTEPNLMQRLTAYRVLTERRLGNWSGVGAGKTLAAILASRVIDAHLTVIVAFNSTLKAWGERIKETFPDSLVYVKERGNVRVNPSTHTYLILNFETFQQPDSVELVSRLIEKYRIDFIVLDEIQSVKQRSPTVTSKRRQVVSGLLTKAGENNPNLCVLGMSATPVINNLYEAKALLELVKGVEFNDLNTFSSIANANAMFEKLILYGIRYRPQYSLVIDTRYVEIPGYDILDKLKKLRKRSLLALERILLDAKIDTIIASLKKGTLVYTHYLTGLVRPLQYAIEKAGFKVGLFTGDDKSGLEPFKKGNVDVLIGSIPVGTGVDGLQYICNRLVVVSLPWTSAEYEQLIGRLYRQGSVFTKVEVIIPQVVLERENTIWSWDKMRMYRIQYKKTLSDAALDGVIPEGELASPNTMYALARDALDAWIKRVEEDGIVTIERAKLRVPLPEDAARVIQRRFGDLSMMNSRFNTAYSSTTHGRLLQNPEEWYLYHTLYREARKDWAEIPYERIAKMLIQRPDWVIGDFGCGEAQLADILPNKVFSFDHVAINTKVTSCDVTHTPLENAVLDVVVFSLSLMGLNYVDYLKEAHRTLKFGGFLKIAEPISRWTEKKEELLSQITETGFVLVGKIEENNQFFYIDAFKTTG